MALSTLVEEEKVQGEGKRSEGKINPLDYGIELNDRDGFIEPYCGDDCPCPCPKVSAPVFAAGYVMFAPIARYQ